MNSPITEAEWKEWLTLPCTKRLREWSQEKKLALMEQWAAGEFTDAMQTAMAVRNAGATGACSVYEELKEMDYNQIGVKDDEPVRT